MKILRKGNDFVKVKHQTMEDVGKIDAYVRTGWKFSSKKDYKEFFKDEKSATEVKADVKAETKVKEKKEKKVKEKNKTKGKK